MPTIAPSTDVLPSPLPLLVRGDAPHSDRSVRTGQLVRVMRGVYAEASEWRALEPWNRYLARVHAAALKYPDAVFGFESAAALRGLPVFNEPPEVHIVLPPSATSRALSGVRTHTAERMPQVEEAGGFVVEAPAEIAVDIARSRHPAIGLAVANAALRVVPTLTLPELAQTNAVRASSRGRRHARWALARASAAPETPLESISLAAVEWLGFPAPELQVWIHGSGAMQDEGDRVDFLWRTWRIAGEADGDIKYSGQFGDAREALRARSIRDARLIDRGIAATAHWGWREVTAVRPLRASLLAAGLPLVNSEDTVLLRSLQRALLPRPAGPQ